MAGYPLAQRFRIPSFVYFILARRGEQSENWKNGDCLRPHRQDVSACDCWPACPHAFHALATLLLRKDRGHRLKRVWIVRAGERTRRRQRARGDRRLEERDGDAWHEVHQAERFLRRLRD